MTTSLSSQRALPVRCAFPSFAVLFTALAGVACSGFDTSAASPGEDAPTGPPLARAPDPNELTEATGVFVAPSGRPENDGTSQRPLDTIQAGVELGKRSGKRVYVCTGTFREAVVLADSISIVGGLDCSAGVWKSGGPRTRIESPSSPALLAKDILSPTRLEGLDVVAPTATQPSDSSIGLLADHAVKLVIASSKITAGDAAKGADGEDGIQLVQTGTLNGATALEEAECALTTCASDLRGTWMKMSGRAGGVSVCSGAPGHDGETGGSGGSGGLAEAYFSGVALREMFRPYLEDPANGPGLGQKRSGGDVGIGIDGVNATALGAFSTHGYVPIDGTAGTDGMPGKGGAGGDGHECLSVATNLKTGTVFRGFGGAGGGAGGCPGLTGTAGKGGGASIAALLTESPIMFDSVEIVSGRGGDAGRGVFGSAPSAGGAGGYNPQASTLPTSSGRAGSHGGTAGISGNGSNGPSIGVASSGAAPVLRDSTVTVGKGGAAIEERARTDALGNTKTILASAPGVSKEMFAF